MSESPPFVLVDGSSYLFRAYHALPDLSNAQGEPTGAIVGVLNMLRRLINDYHPDYIAVIFDAPGGSFRNELYPDYKANRPPMPDDLRCQIEPLHDIIKAMGLPLVVVPGVEADDVIGTLAQQASEKGIKTVISTGDKDMAQLVNEHVSLVNTMSETTTDIDGVVEKFGVRPNQIIDYLALVGDSVDNIPGVPKCGPKTAAKWLQAYETLENLIDHAGEISGKIGDNLRAALTQLPLSKLLATIKLDVVLDHGPTDYRPGQKDVASLRNHYQWMESNRLLASLDQNEEVKVETTPTPPQQRGTYETVLSEKAFLAWMERLKTCDLFAFDTETTSLDYMSADLVGLSFAIQPGEAAYVPVDHDYPGAPEQLQREWVLTQIKPLLEDPSLKKVGQNLKYDMSVLARYGIKMQGIAYDTMLESYVLDSKATRHDMDSLAKKYLQHDTIHFEDIAGKGKKQLTFNQIDLEVAAPYAAEDADITLQLHNYLWPKLDSKRLLSQLFTDLEVALIPVLSRMERHGIRVDRKMLREQSDELAKSMHQLEQQAYGLAGHSFNLGSPKQIGEIFFNELALPVITKTPKGAPSTAESVLVELADQGHELPAVILEYRGVSKLKSTYTDKLPEMANPETGRVHTSYHQAVAATGRLSSSDPNLQNIPVRTQAGRRIRQAFVPEPGWKMLAADYSQIELRIMAHLSGDEGLLRAFSEGKDIHSATAAEVFEEPLEQVTPEQRRSAKAINFGLIYGMSAFGLARQLGIERSAAQAYVDLYFKRYPGVSTFMEQTREQAHQQGYVETLFGRRLYLPDINARNHQRKTAAERTAINAPMQGSAADIIKRAMLAVDGWIENSAPPARLLMQVHDELVLEVEPAYVAKATQKLRDYMESAATLAVPLLVEVGVGDNWDEAH
ncbi:MAG: DNA polymerase I [Candidatus Thiodiazotropha sp. (ex Codakia rugifera)]|nr:DNA polymerase I [Candidatus Thiodiazotropha sp. (ex Codakia rugifera)]